MGRSIKIVISLLFIVIAIPVFADNGDVFTASTVEGVELKYTITSEENKLCELSNAVNYNINGGVTIPEKVGEYTVCRIGSKAFYGNSLTSITIPWNITEIGYEAFNKCSALKEIRFLGAPPPRAVAFPLRPA